MNFTDKDIRKALLLNDDKFILKFVYSEVLPIAVKFIVKNNGKKEDAEDLVQDALMALIRYLNTHPYVEISNVGGFLIQSVKNLWITKIKKKSIEINTEKIPDLSHNEFEKSYLDKEKEDAFNEAFNKLSSVCKELLRLTTWESKNMVEIANMMGFANANTAKSKSYNCRQQLGTIIKASSKLKEILTL